MNRLNLLSALSAIVVGTFLVGGQANADDTLKDFMRVKLDRTQKLLEGLLTEDYLEVASNSQELSLLSLAETWQVLTTQEYIEYSRKFRNAADNLTEMAKKRDLDRSTQAFNLVTTRCVECHKYLRTVRLVGDDKK